MVHTHSKRIHTICVEAIEDIIKKTGKILDGFNEKQGTDLKIDFVSASKILGIKYKNRNFGKLTDSEIIKILHTASGPICPHCRKIINNKKRK